MFNEIENYVKKALSEVLMGEITESDIKIDDSLVELGIDSITFIKFVVSLESKFEIEFEDEELDYSKFVTLKDIVKYLEDKIYR